MLQQQLEALEEYDEQIDEQIEELNTTQNAIEELSDGEEGAHMFSPIGSGAFAMTEVADTDKVLVDLGADTYAKKSVDDAISLLDERKEELRDSKKRIQEQREEMQDRLVELLPKLQQIQQQMGGGQGQAGPGGLGL